MKSTKILEKEILEIEQFGPADLLLKIGQCSCCKSYFYHVDMVKIEKNIFCAECSVDKLMN